MNPVRKGKAEDHDRCLKIVQNLPLHFTQQAWRTIEADLKSHELFLVEKNSCVVGFATVRCKSEFVAEISWMAVDEEERSRGWGTMLLEGIANELKKRGKRLLEVKTLAPTVEYPPYAATRAFYEKHGFVLLEVIDPFPGWEPGNPCAIYVHTL